MVCGQQRVVAAHTRAGRKVGFRLVNPIVNLAEILETFDQERREVEFPYGVREATDRIVRHVNRYGADSLVVFSSHPPEDLVEAVSGEISYFRGIGHDFEWKAYSHDQPKDLVERLGSMGFAVGPPEAVVVAEVDRVWGQIDDSRHEIRCLSGPEELGDYVAVRSEIWPRTEGDRQGHLAEQMRNGPESIAVYVAYIDGVAVGCSRSSFHPDSVFSGLWGGCVLPAHRRKGVYRSMIARRAKDAASRGVRYLQVDALPTSLPILERIGFQRLSVTHPCLWRF